WSDGIRSAPCRDRARITTTAPAGDPPEPSGGCYGSSPSTR
ncbi:MAG: hypothetical protein AVDCRST_MAG70-666, partial [uncultured Thermomicrobiales bacterium]